MASNSVIPSFPIFNDIDGSPLESGYIYCGVTGLNPEVSPKDIFWDEALTIPAAQPIRTIGGYPSRSGTPAMFYTDGNYSLTVRNKNSSLIYSSLTRTFEVDASDIANQMVASVDTIADMLALDATLYLSVNVRGYYTAGDGGGGAFNYDATQSAVNNGGTIINGWVRQNDKVTVKQFGAKGGTTDDTVAVQAAINTGASEIDFDGLICKLTSTVALVSSQKLFNGGILSFVDNPALQGVGLSYVNIDGLKITLDSSVSISGTSRGVYLQSCTFSNIENCHIENFSDAGIRTDGGSDVTIQNNTVFNCYRKAEASIDDNDAYGSIAVFGQSVQSKRIKVLNNSVFTGSTGISMFAGEGNEISGNKVVANTVTLSVLAMGIYCGGSLYDAQITNNFVKDFHLEGIDVHNTGVSAVSDMQRIVISENTLAGNSYTGISVVGSVGFEIQNITIDSNTIISDSTSHLTYSHGIILADTKNISCSNNSLVLATSGVALTSYGIYATDSTILSITGNVINGDYDRCVLIQNSPVVTISSNTIDVNVAKSGITFATGTLGGKYTVIGNTLQGADASSVLLHKITGGINLQYATISSNSFYVGTINIDASQHLVFVSNMLQLITTPSIVDNGQGLISFNKGYLDTEAGTTKTTPGTVNQWMPVERSGVIYYIPMYTSKTT